MPGTKSDDDASVTSGRQKSCVLTAPCNHMVLCRMCCESGEQCGCERHRRQIGLAGDWIALVMCNGLEALLSGSVSRYISK